MAKRNPNKKFYNIWNVQANRWTNTPPARYIHNVKEEVRQDITNPVRLSLNEANLFFEKAFSQWPDLYEVRELVKAKYLIKREDNGKT